METVFIVIHLMVIVAMVALVLLQRSEGGALGIGGGGGGGGFMAGRGQGNILTRSTAILAVAFFGTSIVLSVLAQMNAPPSAILDEVPTATTPADGTGVPTSGGILDQLEGMSEPGQAPAVPETPGGGAAIPTTPAPSEPQIPTSQ